MEKRDTALWVCLGSVALSLGLRVLYLSQPWRIDLSEHPVFIADEGVVGLMGRHILEGGRPLFYYGQYYMGALEAYLAAGVFYLFGDSMTTLRLVPVLCSLVWIPLVYGIARRLFEPRSGLLAAALIALPSPFIFEWGFKARGGYALHVALVLAVLYLLLRLFECRTRGRIAAFGFLSGLSLWVNQLAVPYVPIYAYALYKWVPLRRRDVATLTLTATLGVSPLLYGNVVEPLATVRALATEVGSSLRLGSKPATQAEAKPERSYRSIPLLQVLGAQPRRDGKWSITGTLAALLLVLGSLGSLSTAYRSRSEASVVARQWVAVLAFTCVSVAVGAAGFSGQPVGRYQLVLFPLLCVLAANGFVHALPKAAIAIVLLLVSVQAFHLANPQAVNARVPRETVVASLQADGLRYGYSAGFMQDLVFAAHEQIIIVPVERARIAAYESRVANADRIFYIFRVDQRRKPAHTVFLRTLEERGLTYREGQVGEYRWLYDFEPREWFSSETMAQIRKNIRTQKLRPGKPDSP
jgi:4-amino-4-deoxy-L-arabinose transferase-like glycosyltransferase